MNKKGDFYPQKLRANIFNSARGALFVAMACGFYANFTLAQSHSSTLSSETLAFQITKEHEKKTVFIHFKSLSFLGFRHDYQEQHKSAPNEKTLAQHKTKVMQEHAELLGFLKQFDGELISQLKLSANGIKYRLTPDGINNVERHPLVKSVSIVEQQHLQTSNHPSLQSGIPELIDLGYTGKGTTIAIIGSGINYELETFGGRYSVAQIGSITNDNTVIEPNSFPTSKVIAGVDLAGSLYNPSNPEFATPVRDPDPFESTFSHESRVAAVAAGQPTQSNPLARGVAPDAKLMSIKIFRDGAISGTELIAEGIEFALDPNEDGNTDDRANIINISLGVSFDVANQAETIAIQNAVKLGVTIIGAAGNDGNQPFRINRPNNTSEVIAVASHASASSNPKESKNLFVTYPKNGETVSLPTFYFREGRDITTLDQNFSANIFTPKPIDSCDSASYAGAEGKIVIARFKSCRSRLRTQARLASDQGAVGFISISENIPRLFSFSTTMPSYAMKPYFGEQLLADITKDRTRQLTLAQDNILFDDSAFYSISSFSSRGPNLAGQFKPDIAAPGENVSAGDAPAPESGTSFASPFIAGIAAVLLEAEPTLSPLEIKARLQNSTVPIREVNRPEAPSVALSRQGVGRVEPYRVLNAKSVVYPASLSFGNITPDAREVHTRTVTLRNNTNQRRHYAVSHERGQTSAGLELRLPRTVHVPPHSEKEIDIVMHLDPRKLKQDTRENEHIEHDGWVTFSDDIDTLRVGYLTAVEPASKITANQDNSLETVRIENNNTVQSTFSIFDHVDVFDTSDVSPSALPNYPYQVGLKLDDLNQNRKKLTILLSYNDTAALSFLRGGAINLTVYDNVRDIDVPLRFFLGSNLTPIATNQFSQELSLPIVRSDIVESSNGRVDFNKSWVEFSLTFKSNVIGEDTMIMTYEERSQGELFIFTDLANRNIFNNNEGVLKANEELSITQIQQAEGIRPFIFATQNKGSAHIVEW